MLGWSVGNGYVGGHASEEHGGENKPLLFVLSLILTNEVAARRGGVCGMNVAWHS